MRLFYALTLDVVSASLTLTVLTLAIRDIPGHRVTPADGLTVAVLALQTAFTTFRAAILGWMRRHPASPDRHQTLVWFSSLYITLLWMVLQIAIRLLEPQRPVFGLVGRPSSCASYSPDRTRWAPPP